MLHRRQWEYFTAFDHLSPAEIHRTAIQLQNSCVLFVAPAQNSIDPQQKFLWQKRLCDIVVCSKAKSCQLVRRLVTGRQKNHGNIRPCAYLLHPNDRLKILREIGSFIEVSSFYANLTGWENLDVIRRILGLRKNTVEDALELVGLSEFGDRLAKKYSLGMKQRLGLAGALLGRPPILILDEPTNGLAPSGIHEIRNLVRSLPELYDCTILISSHMLSEIELMADDIGILNHGRLLFEGSLDDLRHSARQAGMSADNLEDVFLSIVEQDNAARKQRAKL